MPNETPENFGTVPLSQPITDIGEEIKELVFIRKPTGRDLMDLGTPTSITDDGRILTDYKIIGKYIERCCNVSPKVPEQLTVLEFNAAAEKIAVFFYSARAVAARNSDSTDDPGLDRITDIARALKIPVTDLLNETLDNIYKLQKQAERQQRLEARQYGKI